MLPDKPRCTVITESNGDRHFVVEREKLSKDTDDNPPVNIWWNRDPKKVVGGRTYRKERLVLRQENGRVGADVILITPGQVYDLIDALCRAAESR